MAQAAFGKYRLLAELGQGGMADVFLAVVAGPIGSGFSKLTVVKRLRSNLADDPEFVAMLVDEARITARLNHQNVVQTLEVGKVNQQYFIAMEFLDGQPLHRIQYRAWREETPITKAMQYLVLADTLAGLHHAHELADYDGTPLQVVHRDVTPHNIFVTYDGQAKVVDFGIAKAVGRSAETKQGVVKGKVRYMAPEQVTGGELDRRADIFALGVILWETATTRRMWKNVDDLQIVQALVAGEIPTSPRAVDPTVPEAIDRICTKALARNPDERYATAEDFRSDLEQYLADSGQAVEARRKLGPALAGTFKDRRDEVKTIIEKKLSELTSKGSGEFETAFLPPDPQASPTPSSEAQAITLSLASSVAASAARADERSTTTHTAKRSSGLLITIPVLLVLVAGGGWLLNRRFKTPEAPAATAPASTEIDVALSMSPSDGNIRVDDRDIGQGFFGKMPRDGKEHRITFSAPGHVTRVETVTFDNNVTRTAQLEKVADSSNTAAATIESPPTKIVTTQHGFRAAPPVRVTNTPAMPTTTNATPPPATAPDPAPMGRPDPAFGKRKQREIDTSTDPWAKPSAP